MLGAGTSTFRDRGSTAFRVLLHDTTYRWWTREKDKLVYEGLLLHPPMPLSKAHVEVLKHIIDNGDRRVISEEDQFERSLDQDHDLSPIFMELPPAEFVFQDDALPSMIAAYLRLFGLYRKFASIVSTVAFNCVTAALLFGNKPKVLMSLLPSQTHRAVRAKAQEFNGLWQNKLKSLAEQAHEVFKPTLLQISQRNLSNLSILGISLRKVGAATTRKLSLQEQLGQLGQKYARTVLWPLKQVLDEYDPQLGKAWANSYSLTKASIEFRNGLDLHRMGEVRYIAKQLGVPEEDRDKAEDEDDAKAALIDLIVATSIKDGCKASEIVELILFCPDWQNTSTWKAKLKSSSEQVCTTIVQETFSSVRKHLFWNAARQLNGKLQRAHRLLQDCCWFLWLAVPFALLLTYRHCHFCHSRHDKQE